MPPNQPPELAAGACACACGWEAAGLAGVEDELDAAAGLGLEAAEEAERAGAGAAGEGGCVMLSERAILSVDPIGGSSVGQR